MDSQFIEDAANLFTIAMGVSFCLLPLFDILFEALFKKICGVAPPALILGFQKKPFVSFVSFSDAS